MKSSTIDCAEHGAQPLRLHPRIGLSACAACLDARAAQPLRFTLTPAGRVGVEQDAPPFMLRWPPDFMKSLGFSAPEVP